MDAGAATAGQAIERLLAANFMWHTSRHRHMGEAIARCATGSELLREIGWPLLARMVCGLPHSLFVLR